MSVILRSAITILLLIAFVALWIRTWSRKHKAEYEAMGRIPLEEDLEAGKPKDEPPTKGPAP